MESQTIKKSYELVYFESVLAICNYIYRLFLPLRHALSNSIDCYAGDLTRAEPSTGLCGQILVSDYPVVKGGSGTDAALALRMMAQVHLSRLEEKSTHASGIFCQICASNFVALAWIEFTDQRSCILIIFYDMIAYILKRFSSVILLKIRKKNLLTVNLSLINQPNF